MAGIAERPIDPAGGVNFGGLVDLGQGLALYVGTGVFTTTGATCVISHPFGTGDIFAAMVSPHCASGSEDQQDQPLYFTTSTSTANTLKRDTTYGTLKSVTAGKATIARLANGSSGLGFSVIIIGRARH